MVKISSCRKLREPIGSMCASVGEWMHGNNVSLLECLAKAGSIISCSDFIKCASVTRFLREAGCHSVRCTNTHSRRGAALCCSRTENWLPLPRLCVLSLSASGFVHFPQPCFVSRFLYCSLHLQSFHASLYCFTAVSPPRLMLFKWCIVQCIPTLSVQEDQEWK